VFAASMAPAFRPACLVMDIETRVATAQRGHYFGQGFREHGLLFHSTLPPPSPLPSTLPSRHLQLAVLAAPDLERNLISSL
jgi:hypothetical protein